MRKLLLPLSFIYWLIVRIKNFLYDINILKSKKSSIPNIVVGNITVGGTGKTPFTIFLTKILSQKYRVAILSRGYKRKSKGCFEISEHQSPIETGDEPKLIKQQTSAPTFVCADRLAGLELIKKQRPQTQLVILDDGFQHRKLKPDLGILLLDWTRPVKKDIMLPAGNLRDNIYRIKQADIVIFSKCPKDLSKEQAFDRIKKLHLQTKPVFFTYYKIGHPQNAFSGQEISPDKLRKYQILAFSGLGNPAHFTKTLEELGLKFKFIKFPDHKLYTNNDIKKIFCRFAQISTSRKLIITTAKDAIKLYNLNLSPNQKANIYVLPVEIAFLFDQEKDFKSKIYSYGRKLINQD